MATWGGKKYQGRELSIAFGVQNDIRVEYKSRMLEEAVPKTWWEEGTYAAARYGTTLLEKILGPKAL